MNINQENLRYRLLLEQNLSPERIEQLWPPYPTDGPTVVQEEDMRRQQPRLVMSEEEQQQKHQERLNGQRMEFENLLRQQTAFSERKHAAAATAFHSKSQTRTSEPQQPQPQPLQQQKSNVVEGSKLVRSFVQRFFSLNSARASNNWVINGSQTTTGLPFLANDPHLEFSTPSIWILFHLQAPNISAIGASLVGTAASVQKMCSLAHGWSD